MINRVILGVVTLALLVSIPLYGLSPRVVVVADEPEVGEIIGERTLTSKTFYLGDGNYATYGALGPAHYQGGGSWQEIDNAWVAAPEEPWDYQMLHDDYKAYAFSQFNWGQIMRFERGGASVAFQPMELQWTNDYDMIESISMSQNVAATVQNEPVELLPSMDGSIGTLRWDNAYGSGRHFEWSATPGMLRPLLILDAAPPTPTIGSNPVLRQSFLFAPSSELDIYVNGSLWDKKTKTITVQDIEFRKDGQALWYVYQARYWDSGNSTALATTVVCKSGNDLWLDVLVPYDWLQAAVYPVFIDPDTGATYPGTGSNEDRGGLTAWADPTCIQAEANYASWSGTDVYSDYLRGSAFGFAVPSDAVITGVKLDMYREEVSGAISNSLLYLIDHTGATIGNTKHATNQAWSGLEEVSYGGSSDLWGATLTPAIVNHSNFGAWMTIGASGASSARVYWYKITVYYIIPPTTTILAASLITDDTARMNAGVLNDGGAVCEGRFCWGEIEQEDDFEWGSDGDPLSDDGGGIDWTISFTPAQGSSLAEIDDEVKYAGTRSARLYRDGTNRVITTFPQSAMSSSQVLSFRVRKDDTSVLLLYHGDGTHMVGVQIDASENVLYYDNAGWQDSGVDAAKDTWHLLEVRNVDWVEESFDVYLNGILIASATSLFDNAGASNQIRFDNYAGTSEIWLDNVRVLANRTTTAWDGGSYSTDDPFYSDLSSLTSGTRHVYEAQLKHTIEGDWSDEETFLTIPAPPTNVAATDGVHTDKVVVTWTKSTGATGYKVYEGDNLLDTLGDVNTYDDTAAPAPTITPGSSLATDGDSGLHVSLSLSGTSTSNGASRTYKVKALNGSGDSGDSNTDTGYRGVGSLTYQWQRSAADSNAEYSNIAGAEAETHDDTGAPAPTVTPGAADASDGTSVDHVTLTLSGHTGSDGEGRYYQCVLNADGAVEQTSAFNRGYRGASELSLQWQRSGADSDANYGDIGGATSNPYNDTDGVSDPDGRYYKCVVSMTGADNQTSSVDRGYKAVVVAPTVISSAATGIGQDFATLHGEITDIGFENATERGFEWGTATGNYTDDWSELGSFGLGTFSHQITGLPNETMIYWRAFAVNSEGTGNSAERSFTTLVALPLLPTNFEITQTDINSINASWLMGVGADTTVVRVSTIGYPAGVTEGYLAYNGSGTSFNMTGLTLDTTTYYVSAWSSNGIGYSVTYATAEIGGAGMAFLAFILLPLGLLALFFWRRSAFLAFFSAGGWLLLGFYSFNVSNSSPMPITDIYMGLFWLCVGATIGCVFLPAVMREKASPDDVYPEEADEVTGDPIKREESKAAATGQRPRKKGRLSRFGRWGI